MEIQTPKSTLYPVLQILQGISDKRNLMPILSHMLLEATHQGLRLAASDLEVSMEHRMDDVNVLVEGAATVPCRKVFEVLREMPDDVVHIRVEEGFTVRIACQDIVVRLKGLDPGEFPQLTPSAAQALQRAPASTIAEMIDKTIYAVASEDMQFNLTGVHVERLADTDDLRFVATDGHRLSLIDRPVKISIPEGLSVIIPRKGLTELRKLLSSQEADLSWAIMNEKLVVQIGPSTLYIRLIDGLFPAYQEVIPRFGAKRARLNRERLSLALRRAAVLSTQRFFGVNVGFSREGVRIASNNPDLGDSAEVIPVDYNGAPVSILFNPRYLTDVLGALSTETVVMEINDESSPIIIRDPTDDKFLAVVMPMRF